MSLWDCLRSVPFSLSYSPIVLNSFSRRSAFYCNPHLLPNISFISTSPILQYSSHGRLKGSHVSSRALSRKATCADVISWSGCQDSGTSADTMANGVAVGAMSHAFLTALRSKPKITYQELLNTVRHILYPKYSQRPQLSSSHRIDTNLRFIM
jgi:hypothetical protein